MKILVTGAAGFIGSKLIPFLAERGDDIIGLDNVNDYYDVSLKIGRLDSLTGIKKSSLTENQLIKSTKYPNYHFIKLDIEDNLNLQKLFEEQKFDYVCHLAAQAGVRYSLLNPYVYVQSNVLGFLNILEACRKNEVKHLVYASSSSVYGLNAKVPFSERDNVDHPVSLYAATKKSNELMAHSYSSLYNLPTTGLRFFTVYGPWGRPDMAPFIFTEAIVNNKPIKIFNNGHMLRDFTYIDDIAEAVVRVIYKPATSCKKWDPLQPEPDSSSSPYSIYNIGNSNPVKLMDFIQEVEAATGKKAEKIFMPMQPGDVYQTYADTTLLQEKIDFKPTIDIKKGIRIFVDWYKLFYAK